MSRRIAALISTVLAAVLAAAEPFYLRYDANETFPEQDGWARSLYDPNDAYVRSIEDGQLVLDSRGSLLASDRYTLASEVLTPAPGERFEMTWRVQTIESTGNYGESDVSVALLNPSLAYVGIYIGRDFVAEDRYLFGFSDYIHPVNPDQPHTYSLKSSDLLTYELFVDGLLAFAGDFHWQGLGTGPRAVWGDLLSGGVSSQAAWDYVELAVVPDPSMVLMASVVPLVLRMAVWRK